MIRVRNSCPVGYRLAVSAAVGLAVALAAVIGPSPATASDLQPLLDRIERMERDLRTLNVRVARGVEPTPATTTGASAVARAAAPIDGDTSGSLARLDVRVTGLEDEMRALTGKLETVEYRIRTIDERLDKLVADVDFRLGALEKGRPVGASAAPPAAPMAGAASDTPAIGAAATPPPLAVAESRGPADPPGQPPSSRIASSADMSRTPPATGTLGTLSGQDMRRMPQAEAPASPPAAGAAAASASPSATQAAGSAEDRYRQAFNLLQQARYPEAEAALRDFLERAPNHELAGNARYWLGETHYVRADYASAAQTFLEGYTKEPKGKKAPDSLLKLGMSLSNLDKKREACAAFSKLDKEFPDAPANLKKVLAREKERGGCR